jgi:membrane dipeptidase
MLKYSIIACSIFLVGFICSSNQPKSTSNSTKTMIDSTTKKFSNPFELHYDAIVVDTHNDILMQVMEKGANISRRQNATQSDLVRMITGGLDVQIFSLYVPEKYKKNHFDYVKREIDKLEEIAAANPELLTLCYDYESLIRYINKGTVCGLMGGEGGTMIEGSLENLEYLYNRGMRYLTLTWNTSNQIGSSARDESRRGVRGGLTDFGKQVVQKMDELGMLIDVSHLGENSFWDVIALSKNPIIASHSCVYSLNPHYRNLKDEQIKAIANSGGVVFINFYTLFLDGREGANPLYKNSLGDMDKTDLIKFNEQRMDFIANNPLESGTSADRVIEHIDYIVKLVGADYVGLGSDFDGQVTTPNELYDATCYPIITKKLWDLGYSQEDIRKILGGNFLRVFKQINEK